MVNISPISPSARFVIKISLYIFIGSIAFSSLSNSWVDAWLNSWRSCTGECKRSNVVVPSSSSWFSSSVRCSVFLAVPRRLRLTGSISWSEERKFGFTETWYVRYAWNADEDAFIGFRDRKITRWPLLHACTFFGISLVSSGLTHLRRFLEVCDRRRAELIPLVGLFKLLSKDSDYLRKNVIVKDDVLLWDHRRRAQLIPLVRLFKSKLTHSDYLWSEL